MDVNVLYKANIFQSLSFFIKIYDILKNGISHVLAGLSFILGDDALIS